MNIPLEINKNRIFSLKDGEIGSGSVIYWMSRDQRAHNNWALLYAAQIAINMGRKLEVVFTLAPSFDEATIRHYAFMIKGLQEAEKDLLHYNIPLIILLGEPIFTLPQYIEKNNTAVLVTDFDPLKIKQNWKRIIANEIRIPFYEVDSHNIVPCRFASTKQEYGAYTLRPKINKLLHQYLDQFPDIPYFDNINNNLPSVDFNSIFKHIKVNTTVGEVAEYTPGTKEAEAHLTNFIQTKIDKYNLYSNNPTVNVLSDLSPYLHFGQISAQHIVFEIMSKVEAHDIRDSFLEQLIVRRELADNYCLYNSDYDNYNGFPDWAKKTLDKHLVDKREYIYSLNQFENAQTHDALWNAAQQEMVIKGKMHSYMRMYWAKKILEWTSSANEALYIANYLNNKYELDGRDPNGFVGCAWSIGGVHDRAWFERPVFGQIRYMNYNGCKSKFDVLKYIQLNS